MASDYDYLPGSNGSGDAALMHVTVTRAIAGTVITVDTVVNVPSKFVGTYGSLLPTGYLDPTTMRNFKGHVSGSTLVIDGFEAGSSDNGNSIGDVVVIKPNSGWTNRVAQAIKNITGFGTPEGGFFAALAASGNATVGGTLGVTGATTLTGAVGGTGYDVKTQKNSCKFFAYFTATENMLVSTKMGFESELYDTGNNFDAVTNHRFVAPVNGFYHFDALDYISSLSDQSNATIYLYKNGTDFLRYAGNNSGVNDLSLPISADIQLAANDYIEVFQNNSQGTRNHLGTTASGGSILCRFSGHMISAT